MRNTDGLWKGGSPGRPLGVPNRATAKLREQLQDLVFKGVESPEFQQNLVGHLKALTINPKLLALVLAYGFGRPASAADDERHGDQLERIICGIISGPVRADQSEDHDGRTN